jgi:membrane-bound lytic murein transglycosylase B
LIIFVVLLVAGAVAGSVVVPGAGPNPGAAPPASAAAPGLTTPVPEEPSPTGPHLPTPPVRPADQLASWAQRIGGVLNVPAVAIQAYGYAQLATLNTDPSCHLSWTTVAAVGEVESQHGQVGGAVLQSNGRSAPLVVGAVLDGKNGQALVNDTDAGAFDGDTTYDRAMGPLGLTPTVWRAYGIDADADGILDPYDIDDASLALARLLCSGAEDLSQRAGWDAAIARQHTGSTYAKSVFTSADSYGQRTKNMG